GWFVAGFVVWKLKSAGNPRGGAIQGATAVEVPLLMSVTKAVAGVPTCTERLDGRTDASSGGTAGGSGPHVITMEESNTLPVAPLTLFPKCTHVPVWLIATDLSTFGTFGGCPTPNFVQVAAPSMLRKSPLLVAA